MITLDLPDDIQHRLEEASRASGESLSSIARSAFLNWLEDYEDVKVAERRLADLDAGRSYRVSLDEVMKNLSGER